MRSSSLFRPSWWLADEPADGRADVGLLIVRVFFGLVVAFGHGWAKLFDLQGFTDLIAAKGFPVPGLLGPVSMLAELVGGMLLALGFATRPAALVLSANMLVAVLTVHGGDPFAKKELALAYAAAAFAIFVAGPGRHSLDAMLSSRRFVVRSRTMAQRSHPRHAT